MGNKSDIESSATSEEIGKSFNSIQIKDRPLKIVCCSARLNHNLDESIRWIVHEAVEFRKLKNS